MNDNPIIFYTRSITIGNLNSNNSENSQFINSIINENSERINNSIITNAVLIPNTIRASDINLTSEILFPNPTIIQRIYDEYIANQKKLNIEEYENSIEKIEEKIECPICFNNFDNCILIKNCDHKFCEKCIKNWLIEQKGNCPMCRINLKLNNN